MGGNRAQERFQSDIDTAERDAAIARYWTPDRTIQDVADHFQLNKSTISRARQRAILAARKSAGEETIATEIIKLDGLEEAAYTVLRANHFTVSDGRVVKLDDKPLSDHKPVLMAIDRLLRIAERRARLLGLDAPVKIDGKFTDATDAAIEQLAAELAQLAEAGEGSPAPAVESREAPPGH